MQRIVAHIERLLVTHDCVIVPKLGGFVLQSVPASYSHEEHVFRPMRKDLLFNGTLNHQDGLLVESYMKAYDVTYRKAAEMVEQDIEVLLERLNQTRNIELGSIGTLSLGEEGRIVFQVADENVFNVEAYGLPSFYMTPLSLLRKEGEELFVPTYNPTLEKKKDTIYIRINKRVLRVTGSVAAVIAFILLLSTPIKEVNHSTYTASFVPAEMSIQKPVTNQEVNPVAEESTPAELTSDTTSETIIPEEVTQPEPEPAPVVQKSGKIYYIVIGSFPNEEMGKQYMSEVDRSISPNVGYVVRGEKVRVYSDKFDDKKEAEAYLATLRKTDKHKDAWLFISR